jgi:hypothetical protein
MSCSLGTCASCSWKHHSQHSMDTPLIVACGRALRVLVLTCALLVTVATAGMCATWMALSARATATCTEAPCDWWLDWSPAFDAAREPRCKGSCARRSRLLRRWGGHRPCSSRACMRARLQHLVRDHMRGNLNGAQPLMQPVSLGAGGPAPARRAFCAGGEAIVHALLVHACARDCSIW